MRALFIDKDKTTNQGLAFFLKGKGFVTDSTLSGEEATELARLYDYDLILLDQNPAGESGLDVLKKIRHAGIKAPIIILSGPVPAAQKAEALLQGADDYVTRPYERVELFARIQAVIRRSRGYADSVVRVSDMCINLDSKIVTVNDQALPLTGKEYALLELLALRRGQTVSKEQFLNHLYGGLDEPEMKIIDVFLCRIRQKIARLSGGKPYIKTVWGRGYILQDE